MMEDWVWRMEEWEFAPLIHDEGLTTILKDEKILILLDLTKHYC